ncbi:hypothetical protein [Oligoflexus tunisiensis]|uniref:hypothetical protein n=1 Tax=Oligoflexus tunisiensis TaxID=708132 RepID=UPI00114D27B2|nr:hypothetical protein [Oligoflexus tunisiensis]
MDKYDENDALFKAKLNRLMGIDPGNTCMKTLYFSDCPGRAIVGSRTMERASDMHYMKILIPISLLLGCFISSSACSSKDSDTTPSGGTCSPLADELFIESASEAANKTTLANMETVSTAIAVTYDKTQPSGLQWAIQDEGLNLDGKRYDLRYSQENFWNVIGPDQSLVGSLVPYRTESCATVSKVELVMFTPEETAAAFISYMKL